MAMKREKKILPLKTICAKTLSRKGIWSISEWSEV